MQPKSKNQLWREAGKPGRFADFSRDLDMNKPQADFKNASGIQIDANLSNDAPQTWLDNNGAYRAFGTNEVVGYADGNGGMIKADQMQENSEGNTINQMFPPREMTNKANTVEIIGKPANADESHPEVPLKTAFSKENIFYGLMGIGIGVVLTIALKKYYGQK